MRKKNRLCGGRIRRNLFNAFKQSKNLCIDSIFSCNGNTKLSKKAKSIKEYLKAKDIYIVFDSDNQTKETKIQEIKEQLQKNPKEEHRLNKTQPQILRAGTFARKNGKRK
ncbi:hypothetical protein NP0157_02500 [Helicobacter pylori]